MPAYILKRILYAVLAVFVLSFAVFALLRIGPVDPARAYLISSRIPVTAEALEVTREELGLNKPLTEQYAEWLGNAVKLDFGKSYITKRDVFKDLCYYFPGSLKLAVYAMIFLILVSLPLGILSACKKGSFLDKAIQFYSFLGVSVPNFWLGFMLLYFFSLKLQLIPAFGMEGPQSYILPVLTLSFMSLAINTRLTRTSFLSYMQERSLQYLTLLGIHKTKIYGKYTLKNAMFPIVTSFGMHFGELLGGAFVVEVLFAFPGVGRFMVSALFAHDFPVLQCFMVMITCIFLCVNLVTDIIYAYLNPKIVYEEKNYA